jgi:ComF family protein
MPTAATSRLPRPAVWLGKVLDELMPPGVEPDGAADWIPDRQDAYCPRCGASTGPGEVTPRGCAFCIKHRFPWQRITRLSFYGQPMDEWVRQLKFNRRWRWGNWMGRQLANAIVPPQKSQHMIVCPVPMHRLRRWRRGYNQAELIARAVANAHNLPLAPVLTRTRHTPPQTAIAPSLRHENVRYSFAIEPADLTGHEVLLIDDVKTTGATLAACTRLLKQAGARSVHAAVVAVADPKGQGFTAI